MRRIAAILSITFSSFAMAESSVWKVSHGSSYFYLAGTVHVLRATDFPLPPQFDRAYDDADKLAFETDIGVLMNPVTQVMLMKQLAQPQGRTLQQQLSPDTWAELSQRAAAFGLPDAQLQGMSVAGVFSVMLALELRKMGASETGVDQHYYGKAYRDQKPRLSLESVQEQLKFFSEMGKGYEDEFIRQMLADLDRTSAMMVELIDAWRTGDQRIMKQYAVDDMKRDYPQMYQQMLVDRNNNWMKHIDDWAETPEVELILVGAAHLVGPDGLLEQLKSSGMMIEQLP